MIAFDQIDNRLKLIGKDRYWLAEAAGRTYDSIRTALAPGASKAKRSSRLQRDLTDAIEREEAAQREAQAPQAEDLTAKLEELNRQVAELRKEPGLTLRPTPDQFEEWEQAALDDNLTLTKWAMKVLNDAVGDGDTKVVPLPVRPHIVAAAGSPLGAEVEEWEGADNTVRVRISGLSMVPLLNDGEVIAMHHRRAARSQYMKKGLIYLVAYQNGYTVKRYNTRVATDEEIGAGISYVSRADGRTKVHLLESLNPKFPEIVIKDHAEWIAWIEPKELAK